MRDAALAAAVLVLLATARSTRAETGPAAVWNAPADAAARLNSECPPPFSAACLPALMARAGASAEAVDFARAFGGQGYMISFGKRGRVDLARARTPFRDDAAEEVLMVNGDPALVDAADPALLRPLLEDPRLAALRRDNPGAALWPGAAGSPGLKSRAGGGQRFVFALPLRTCRGCANLATAISAFDFDPDGRFSGARLLGVREPSLFRLSGTAARGKPFEAPLGSGMVLRLEPFPEGWSIAVKDSAGRDYCAIVTPPFSGPNDLVIRGGELRGGGAALTRNFRCVSTAAEYAEASGALGKVLWGEGASAVEIARARARHDQLSSGGRRGRLTITGFELSGPPAEPAPAIETMKFRFELLPSEASR